MKPEARKAVQEAERRRADTLARANAAIRSTLGRLAEQHDLNAFLADILSLAASEFGACGGAFWIARDGPERVLLSLHEGAVVTADVSEDAGPGGHRQWLHGPALALARARGEALKRGVTSGFSVDEIENRPELEPYRDVLQAMGVRRVLVLPMFLGDTYRGTMALRFKHERRFSPDEEQFAHALANQAVLALELDSLGEAARQAAVAREREAAARQRSEAAERTAETFRLSLDLLAKEPELERFLGHVLLAANTQLNVKHCTLWLLDPKRLCNTLHMTCDEGQLTVDPLDESREPIVAWLADITLWRRFVEGRAPMVFDDAANNPQISQNARAAFKAAGVRTLMLVPLIFGSQMLGSLGIDNTERDSWTEDEVNLAKALGDEATLALQLTRLASQARDGAVFEERNRLAREIHDTLAQGFAAIRLQLELARDHGEIPSPARQALELAYQIAGENLVEARRSIAVLQSQHLSLAAALGAAAEGVRRLGPAQVVTKIRVVPEPPSDIAHELLRIAQEAMLNAVRHADAGTIELSMSAIARHGLRIAISDDGKGFDPVQLSGGFGLACMRERAAAIGAELIVLSGPGSGVQVTVTWSPRPPGPPPHKPTRARRAGRQGQRAAPGTEETRG